MSQHPYALAGWQAGRLPHVRVGALLGLAIRALALYSSVFMPAANAQVAAPNYEECRLDSIYPAGGQRGQTVTVEFSGYQGGVADARDIVIDGPPGITVGGVKNISADLVQADLTIAPDAPSGRRFVRVLSGQSGLTNMATFVVSELSEHLETEPNNDPNTANTVTQGQATQGADSQGVVVNGRVNPAADVDCYRFHAAAGRQMVAAIASWSIDCHGQGSNYGYVDADLSVLDSAGRVLAEAQDSVGLDPIVEFAAPADGWYVVQIQLATFKGFPQAVYRCTVGEVPVVTSVFPPGGRRGSSLEVELFGPNIGAGTRRLLEVTDEPFPLVYLSPEGIGGGLDVAFMRGDLDESIEAEPNDSPEQAKSLILPSTVNGRFERAGDDDWYRLRLDAARQVTLETFAQRHLRSGVDTRIRVYDSQGALVAENDDGFAIDYMSIFDFIPFDSLLTFQAEAEEYLVRISEETATSGPRAVYRLTARPAEGDFQLYQFPDAVPIWGPGSTAALFVEIERSGGLADEIELSVEGLPAGWRASVARSPALTSERPASRYDQHHFLTITAPADAPPATAVPFRVVGRTMGGGSPLVREALAMTLYYTSDTGFFRASPVSRAVVAKVRGPWLENMVDEVTVARGQKVEIPVRVHGAGGESSVSLVVNLGNSGVGCAAGAPVTVPIRDGLAQMPLTLPDDLPAGSYGITVARAWRSDIRIGMPGPCTPTIRLNVVP